jgi:hypothetical protein
MGGSAPPRMGRRDPAMPVTTGEIIFICPKSQVKTFLFRAADCGLKIKIPLLSSFIPQFEIRKRNWYNVP